MKKLLLLLSLSLGIMTIAPSCSKDDDTEYSESSEYTFIKTVTAYGTSSIDRRTLYIYSHKTGRYAKLRSGSTFYPISTNGLHRPGYNGNDISKMYSNKVTIDSKTYYFSM